MAQVANLILGGSCPQRAYVWSPKYYEAEKILQMIDMKTLKNGSRDNMLRVKEKMKNMSLGVEGSTR